MDLATRSHQPTSNRRQSGTRENTNRFAIEEIYAYIAVRDGLLEEAQQEKTEAALQRLTLTNDFVANCLGPARQPYFNQCLNEMDAARELKRCHGVDAQIAKLRAQLAAAA